jgi:hypothetical protein
VLVGCADIEPGLFRPALKFIERPSVSWKSVVERVLEFTKPDKYVNLVVIDKVQKRRSGASWPPRR